MILKNKTTKNKDRKYFAGKHPMFHYFMAPIFNAFYINIHQSHTFIENFYELLFIFWFDPLGLVLVFNDQYYITYLILLSAMSTIILNIIQQLHSFSLLLPTNYHKFSLLNIEIFCINLAKTFFSCLQFKSTFDINIILIEFNFHQI